MERKRKGIRDRQEENEAVSVSLKFLQTRQQRANLAVKNNNRLNGLIIALGEPDIGTFDRSPGPESSIHRRFIF